MLNHAQAFGKLEIKDISLSGINIQFPILNDSKM